MLESNKGKSMLEFQVPKHLECVFRYVKLCCAINVARELQVYPVDVYPLKQSVALLWGGDTAYVADNNEMWVFVFRS